MIFIVNFEAPPEVIIYNSLEQITHSIEWQDIFEGRDIIIDHEGNQYKWNDLKQEEFGTVYDYTLKKFDNKNQWLSERLIEAHFNSGYQSEFSISKDELSPQINLDKEYRILKLVDDLCLQFGKDAFKIRDNWESDKTAIGFVDISEKYLVYISADSEGDTFYVSLENPPIDSDNYKPAGDYFDIQLEEVFSIFNKHLRIKK